MTDTDFTATAAELLSAAIERAGERPTPSAIVEQFWKLYDMAGELGEVLRWLAVNEGQYHPITVHNARIVSYGPPEEGAPIGWEETDRDGTVSERDAFLGSPSRNVAVKAAYDTARRLAGTGQECTLTVAYEPNDAQWETTVKGKRVIPEYFRRVVRIQAHGEVRAPQRAEARTIAAEPEPERAAPPPAAAKPEPSERARQAQRWYDGLEGIRKVRIRTYLQAQPTPIHDDGLVDLSAAQLDDLRAHDARVTAELRRGDTPPEEEDEQPTLPPQPQGDTINLGPAFAKLVGEAAKAAAKWARVNGVAIPAATVEQAAAFDQWLAAQKDPANGGDRPAGHEAGDALAEARRMNQRLGG